MAVGEGNWGDIKSVSGVKLGVANARIKDNDRDDVLLIALDDDAKVSAVFTQNAFCAEPVKLAREHISIGSTRYLIINSGNANACTGIEGRLAAVDTCEAVAKKVNVAAHAVLPFSTGVIGELLPVDKIISAIPHAFESLSENNWDKAAQAIMTTDTRPKGASDVVLLEGKPVTMTGIAKGAGMINPNMATMLAFVATDANIEQALLDKLCKDAAIESFNRITIDGDTSTNDACVLMATGKAKNNLINDPESEQFILLKKALINIYQALAKEIVKDGEGATKFITVNVRGGKTKQECDDVAYAIAHSPLVKTAMFASDPNWGRIICAIGYAGIDELDVAPVKVYLDDVLIVENGGRAVTYTEEQGQKIVDQNAFCITVELGRGAYEGVIWTSDLSHEYVRINAEYRS